VCKPILVFSFGFDQPVQKRRAEENLFHTFQACSWHL
jgi:hypothetical protein